LNSKSKSESKSESKSNPNRISLASIVKKREWSEEGNVPHELWTYLDHLESLIKAFHYHAYMLAVDTGGQVPDICEWSIRSPIGTERKLQCKPQK